MDRDSYGRGLQDTLELQRKFNELDFLMWRQVRLSAEEDPVERIHQIVKTMEQHTAQVDELLRAHQPETQDE